MEIKLFTEKDPRNLTVYLTERAWSDHVVANHPYMDTNGWFNYVKRAIQSPDRICLDSQFEDRQNYYRLIRNNSEYMKVVVRINASKTDNFVITAYRTADIKSGERLEWPEY